MRPDSDEGNIRRCRDFEFNLRELIGSMDEFGTFFP
jgi:hypothetical protein